jgi:hypothetical protein
LIGEAFAAHAFQVRSSAASSYGAENNFRSVVGDPDFRLASDLTTQWALNKRLQPGRKSLLLVTILVTNVLYAVPEVSVRQLAGQP